MRLSRWKLSLILAAFFTAGAGFGLDKPTLVPRPSTPEQEQRIREGIRLHDEGKFDEAIAAYQAVLRENPDSLMALYELSFSQYQNHDLEGSLETARRGVRYQSEFLGGFYLQMGNCLDSLGRPKDAIKIYKEGLKLMPDDALLHYNMALPYGKMGKEKDARACLKRALGLNPNHASSHLALGASFDHEGYRIPAILALARFLVLEPASERAANARRILLEGLQAGVQSGGSDNRINIMFDPKTRKDEGDFSSLEVGLSLAVAGMYLESKEHLSQVRKLADCFSTFLAMMAEMEVKEKKPGFVSRYYVPYFKALKERGLGETYAYLILEGSGNEEVSTWLRENSAKVYEFRLWNNDYKWPPWQD